MGQSPLKSNCCTNHEPAMNTEIETKYREDMKMNGRYDNFFAQGGQHQNYNSAGPYGAGPGDNGMSLTDHHENNKILAHHIRTSSKANLNADEISDQASKIKQLAEIVHYAPLLRLKVISSSSLPKGTMININAQGVEGSFRLAKDGITHFGCKKRAKRVSKHVRQTEILNDYIIPAVSKEIAKKHRGRHFKIEYHVASNCYKIKDLGVGFGTFYKLDFPLALKDNHLLNMGLIFMVVNITYERKDDKKGGQDSNSPNNVKPYLHLKFFGGPCQGEVHILEPSEIPMVVGRHTDCQIHIDDNLLSKHQCSIEYTESNGIAFPFKSNVEGWVLKDGKDRRPSTNGTWLYIGEEQTIYNGMIFKANQTLFQGQNQEKWILERRKLVQINTLVLKQEARHTRHSHQINQFK